MKAKSQKAAKISTQSVLTDRALKSAYEKADKLNKIKFTTAKEEKVITNAKNEIADQIVRLQKRARKLGSMSRRFTKKEGEKECGQCDINFTFP